MDTVVQVVHFTEIELIMTDYKTLITFRWEYTCMYVCMYIYIYIYI